MVLALVCSVALSGYASVDLFVICFDGIPPDQVTPASQAEPIPPRFRQPLALGNKDGMVRLCPSIGRGDSSNRPALVF
jgi:hypothetical protein